MTSASVRHAYFHYASRSVLKPSLPVNCFLEAKHNAWHSDDWVIVKHFMQLRRRLLKIHARAKYTLEHCTFCLPALVSWTQRRAVAYLYARCTSYSTILAVIRQTKPNASLYSLAPEARAGIFKLLDRPRQSPGIDSKESIPPAM